MDGDRAEHVREAVGVLARYVDALGVRTFASLTDEAADRADAVFQAVVRASDVPVVNLESARWHPCQALADAAALDEHFSGEAGRKKFVLTWAPHPNPLPRAVPNSALLMAARMGMEVVVARPEGFALDADVMTLAEATAARHGGSVTETDDQAAALAGAHAVYAKAWSGVAVYTDPAAEAAARRAADAWRVTAGKLDGTDGGVFMHCLPVRRGVVVDGDVLDGPRALHLLQAEYRLHAQKAVLEWVWGLLPDAL
jgi:N-acetylornithine carbamoyltransferase